MVTTAITPVALGLFAAPAFSQVTPEAAQQPALAASPEATQTSEAGEQNSIIVTGSRIKRSDLTSAAPLAVVSQEEFALRGAVNVESVVNNLPQVIPGTTAFSNNPGGGVSTLNLRGLGTTRTLVLVNGRRYMFYDTSQVVDLNTIPTFLIDTVETATGGASAVYGSDAIAGVVNFKLRNNLQGLEVGSQYSLTERGDGRRWETHVALGGEFAEGKGHATVYGEYYKRNPIFQAARAFSRSTFTDDGEGGFTTGGSATGINGRFATTTAFGSGTNYTGLGATFTQPGAASRPFVSPGDLYNYAPTNYLMVPQERWLIGGYGDYEISDHVTAYTEVTYVNNRVDNALAPTPVTGTFTYDLNALGQYLSASDLAQLQTISARQVAAGTQRNQATNALLTAGQVNLTTGRRIGETGLRESLDERNAFRVLAGVRGDFTEKLHFDAYYSFARTRNANIQQGNISRRAFQAGLLDGSLNIFGPNTISTDALNSITILAQNQDISQLQVITGAVSGELFNLGMGGQDIGFAAGTEYRSVSSRFIPDTALSSGDVIGFNAGNPTAGGYHVLEGFAELNVPIIADRPFFKLLEAHGAARYSDYNLAGVGNVWTYAGDVKWSPVQDITFRGQYQRAVRAPNVGELFAGQSQGFPSATDPCATSAAASGTLRNLCIATGVPASAVGTATLQPNTQIQGSFGGNPNLAAEKSTSYTFGAVIAPRFVPRMHITVDYFNIKVKDAIATLGGGVNSILDLCYNKVQDANSVYCQAIRRNPGTGEIDGSIGPDGRAYVVSAGNANVASIKTSGIDVGFDYSQPLNFGLVSDASKLNFSFLGTWTKKNTLEPGPGIDPLVCAGFYGNSCGQPQSKYKWTSRLSFLDGPGTLSVAWRHLSKVRDDDPTTDYTTETIKAFNYFDVAISYNITDSYRLTLGVNNIADKRPPLLGDNQEQANTFPGVYDVLGRDFFVSANFKF